MAKSLLSTKGLKKKVARKTKSETYLVNWKYLGEEPKNVRGKVDLLKAFNWYNVMTEKDDVRQYLKDYFAGDKATHKVIDSIPDNRLPLTAAWLCRIATNNKEELHVNDWVRVNHDIQDASGYYKEEAEDKPKTVLAKPSIQDRVRERGYDIIGDIEELLDKGEVFSLYEWLQKNEIPAMYATKIIDHYKPWFMELYAAATTSDEDLNEAYSHMTKKDMKDRIIFFTKFLEDAERYSGNIKKARAPRKKKAPTTEKLLKNFKYQKESNEYKLQSCDPATIIAAQELWVFNTKYKTLGVYRARGPAGLTVKGASIDGYDSDSSLIKRIGRKPEEYVKKVLSGGKITLRKLMEEIKSEPIAFTDRINTNVVILKVVRQ